MTIANHCRKLTHLALSDAPSSHDALKAIGEKSNELSVLSLSSMEIDQFSIEIITYGCKNITKLFLRGCKNIDHDILKSIAENCPALDTLDLSNTSVNDEDTRGLNGAKQNIALNLANTKVTDEGVIFLYTSLPNLKSIMLTVLAPWSESPENKLLEGEELGEYINELIKKRSETLSD